MNGYPAKKPAMDDLLDSRERMNRASAEFLKIDVNTALAFLHSARLSIDTERQERSRRAARKAYETILRLMARVQLSREDAQILKQGLERLKNELEGLGDAS